MRGRRIVSICIAVAATMYSQCVVEAQDVGTEETVRRLESLERAVTALTHQVSELTKTLRPVLPQPPVSDVSDVEIDITMAATRGSKTASIAVIEFTDFQCPFCAQHARTVYPELIKKYVETEKIRYVVKNLPLKPIHPLAAPAAAAAECAGEQGKYWEMHDRMFADQQALGHDELVASAEALNIDLSAFRLCIVSERIERRINNDIAEAQALDLGGTPVFLVGRLTEGGKVTVTKRIDGTKPIQLFNSVLQTLLDNPW